MADTKHMRDEQHKQKEIPLDDTLTMRIDAGIAVQGPCCPTRAEYNDVSSKNREDQQWDTLKVCLSLQIL